MRIPLSAPDITEAEIQAVVSVLRTPRLSMGPETEAFERSIAEYLGVPHAVALSSGTAGLHLCLRALGIGEGDEVILPSFAFVAVANAILYVGARPVFAEIDPQSLNLDPAKLEARIGSKTRAIIVVHTFGRPADMDPILELARRHKLAVIEDACEALGAQYRGRGAGGIGDFGVFGFYPNKPITTGEGGMVVTRDAAMAETVRALRNQGRRTDDDRHGHRLLGYNYRISELNCALGRAQMARLPEILDRREAAAAEYARQLRGIPDVILPPLSIPEGRMCWFVYVVRLASRFTEAARDAVCERLAARGIGSGRYFAPLHLQPLFAAYAQNVDLTITERMSERTLALPFFNRITKDQIAEVCESLQEEISDLSA